MTTVSTTDTQPYWQALRFYSESWRERHGADMVAMMMDSADSGEDPLNGTGQRSLMWSGLRQRFASSPFSWLWIALIVLSSGVYVWTAYRMVQIGLYANAHGTSGNVDLWHWPVVLCAASLFLVSVTTLTVSTLHIPPLPRCPIRPARWGWTAWLALAGWPVVHGLGGLLAIVSLVAGIRLYRRTREGQYLVLAGLSAAAVAIAVLVAVPQVFILLQENLVRYGWFR